MGVVLHKDSKWYQQWKDFKDNNMVFNRKKHLGSFAVCLWPGVREQCYISRVCLRCRVL